MDQQDNAPSLTWDSRLLALQTEADVYEETPESMCKKLFKRHLLGATLSIVELATKASNERIRLQAAQYVVERNIGRIQDALPTNADDPLSRALAEFVSEIPDNLGD